ncbi:Lachesin [Orchesella cincta]|uniref:Lachesin n=1 Tax=Orchesella cincta TaxID=48709 RepID=A0A1D2MUX9_ORCCI|nr:Lachesin [Orchesella cincta]
MHELFITFFVFFCQQVSWIRKRDSHILTVDRYTFIADERFQVLHNGDTWTLQIKFVQSRDAGVYECQVTTEPKMSQFVQLDVVVPQTKIIGESELFVKSGSTVQLKCIITQSLEQPPYIFWYHDGGRVVSLNGKHQSVERVNSDTTIGVLVIKSAEKRDSGNFTCAPSNLDAASVLLHVLNGKVPNLK